VEIASAKPKQAPKHIATPKEPPQLPRCGRIKNRLNYLKNKTRNPKSVIAIRSQRHFKLYYKPMGKERYFFKTYHTLLNLISFGSAVLIHRYLNLFVS